MPTSGHGAHPVSAGADKILHCVPAIDAGEPLTWSPDGKTLAYSTPQGLMNVPAAGGTPRLVRAEGGMTVGSVAWSPDGTTILAEVFAGAIGGPSSGSRGGIEAFPADGRPPTVVLSPSSAQGSLFTPGLAWSPDGRRFAFVQARPEPNPNYSTYSIVTAAANGTDLQTVARPGSDNPFALTGWTRTASGRSTLGPRTSPTMPPLPIVPAYTPPTIPPLQAPANGPVPAVTGLGDLNATPTIAPGTGTPPAVITGRDLAVGTGPEATINTQVTYKFVAALYSTGQILNSDWILYAPLIQPSSLSAVNFAPGFRDAIVGMKVGGIREVVVPPALAYAGGCTDVCVPANATVIYLVRLLGVV